MQEPKVILDVKKMKTLLGYLAGGIPRVKVGILGGKAKEKRKTDGGEVVTNAQIGFINEFGRLQGKPKIPARSFLNMPLRLYLAEFLKRHSGMTGKELEKAIQRGEAEKLATKLGLIAEEVVQTAFATRGFGNWAPNAPMTVEKKGSDSPLIDTGELRRSISSEVIE